MNRERVISETRTLGSILVLPIVIFTYQAMWVHGWEGPGFPSTTSMTMLFLIFLIMPLSIAILLFLYNSFKKNTTLESFRTRALMMFLISLVPSLSGTFVSLFNSSLVELGKILGAACSLLAYGFTMVFCERLLDRRLESDGG